MEGASERIDYSVAIPAYGNPELLADTLRHALAQRWPADMRWEILVNDDCSNPPFEAILREFEGCVRFERNPTRQGWPENWNKTLEKARGEWVHMLHTDDLVHAGFAPRMWELIRRHPRAAYLHSILEPRVLTQPLAGRLYGWWRSLGRRSRKGQLELVYRAGVEAARHALIQGVRIVTIVVRRDAALSIPGLREDLSSMADEEYVVRLAGVGDVVYCPQALCSYTYHFGQTSLASWLQPNFLANYLHVHEEAIKALGSAVTDQDGEAIRWRVANIACGVARARALAGDLALASAALEDGVRLAPRIATTRGFKLSKLVAHNALVRYVYNRMLCGG